MDNQRIPQGAVWGKLVFVRELPKQGKYRRILCLCSCGNFETRQLRYLLPHTKCRRCANQETAKRLAKERGGVRYKIPEYKIWKGLKSRCRRDKNYAGRGIKVCFRWENSFNTFLADMGSRPSPKHSIDRIDNDGNYEPGNCRWATSKEQSRNKSSNVLLTFKEKTQTLADWATELKMSRSCINSRIRAGWSDAQALGTAPDHSSSAQLMWQRHKNNGFKIKAVKLLTFRGKTQPQRAWARELGLGRNTISTRRSRGWSIERALATPALINRGKPRPF